MLAATRLGDGWLWPLGLLALLQAGAGFEALFEIVRAAALANVALVVLKRHCHRRRPVELGLSDGGGVLGPDVFAFDRFSFPSGHALNAFAAATIVGTHLPVLAPGLLLVAATIAASRLFLGRHFLSDVVAGALIGTSLALLSMQIG
jgi:undecaprenyl-diphosphatase